MEIARESLHVCRKLILGARDVFAKENAARTEVRQHLLQCDPLLVEGMPPIINQYVQGRNRLSDLGPKRSIPLIAYEDFGPVILVNLADFLYVHTIHATARPKVLLPHRKAATAVNANLQYMNLAAHEFAEMTLIDIEVMSPLSDPRAIFMPVKV